MIPRTLVLLPLIASVACDPSTVRVAGLTVDLVTPADVDPLDGVEQLLLRVLDSDGNEVARSTGSPSQGVSLPPLTHFGLVEVEVTGRRGNEVLSAARTGLIALAPDDEWQIDTLFLPVNQAVELQWSPGTQRVGHAALPSPDGGLLLVGGRVGTTPSVSASTEWWDIRTGFAGSGPGLPTGQAPGGVARLPDGGFVLAGGIGSGGPIDRVIVASADLETITDVETLAQATDRMCAASHPSIGALFFTDAGVEVYTPAGRAGMATDFVARRVNTCAEIGERVLTVGDRAGGWGVLDLQGASWPTPLLPNFTAIAGMNDVTGAMVTGLPDGSGWVGGGFGPSVNRMTWRVDLDAVIATRGPDLAEARVDGVVHPWRSGQLVVAGGFADEVRNQPVRSVEIYDPERGSRLTVPVPPRSPTVSVLPGGAVLLTGGLISSSETAGAYAVMPWPGAS